VRWEMSAWDSDVSFPSVIILICFLFAFNLLSADKKPRAILIKGALGQRLSSNLEHQFWLSLYISISLFLLFHSPLLLLQNYTLLSSSLMNMNMCQNVSVSSECHQEQVFAPSCSSSLDDLFSAQNTVSGLL